MVQKVVSLIWFAKKNWFGLFTRKTPIPSFLQPYYMIQRLL